MRLSVECSAHKMGELVVVLPSSFAGGDLEFFFEGERKSHPSLNCNQDGQLTSIVAACVGVQQTLSAVTSGYRLSLVYDIFYPGYHDPHSPKQKLRNIMSAWKQDRTGFAPRFIACLLQNKYSHSATFDACSLRGTDEQLLSVLSQSARDLGFSIYLAQIEATTKTGFENDVSIAWDDAESINELSFASVLTDDNDGTGEDILVKLIVDLDGIPVEVQGFNPRASDFISGPNVTLHEPDSTTYDGEVCRVFAYFPRH